MNSVKRLKAAVYYDKEADLVTRSCSGGEMEIQPDEKAGNQQIAGMAKA